VQQRGEVEGSPQGRDVRRMGARAPIEQGKSVGKRALTDKRLFRKNSC
jgi:hypothetical protein